MSSPIVRFAYTQPAWLVVSVNLFLAALAGALIAGIVFFFLFRRWKKKAMNLEARGEIGKAKEIISRLRNELMGLEATLGVYRVSYRAILSAVGMISDEKGME